MQTLKSIIGARIRRWDQENTDAFSSFVLSVTGVG